MNDSNLTPWKKGQSGNPKGRPKSRVNGYLPKVLPKTKVRKFFAMTSSEIDEWEKTVLTLTFDELGQLAKLDDVPVYIKGLAVAIHADMKNGKTTTLDKLRERQYGKTPERIEVAQKESFEDCLISASLLEQEERERLLLFGEQ